ncbi:MAG: hypothetical protein Q4D02_06915 [Clostridia bacterium]|nr:hypothetical protein [Clostridia bacterium]
MKKRTLRKLAVLALVILVATTLVGGFLTWKTFSTSWKMNSLTDESRYYQETYTRDLNKQHELVSDVEARRDELKQSKDKYVAWVANMNPLLKIGLFITQFIMTVTQLVLVTKVSAFMVHQRKGYARDFLHVLCNVVDILEMVLTALFKAVAWLIMTLVQCVVIAGIFAYGKITGNQRVGIYTTEKPRRRKIQEQEKEKETGEGKIVPFRRKA